MAVAISKRLTQIIKNYQKQIHTPPTNKFGENICIPTSNKHQFYRKFLSSSNCANEIFETIYANRKILHTNYFDHITKCNRIKYRMFYVGSNLENRFISRRRSRYTDTISNKITANLMKLYSLKQLIHTVTKLYYNTYKHQDETSHDNIITSISSIFLKYFQINNSKSFIPISQKRFEKFIYKFINNIYY
jgi:hypothetical protein